MTGIFEPLPNSYSGKVRCKVCGATGYPMPEDFERSWQNAHRRGHGPCPKCDGTVTLNRDLQPRPHARCPR